MCVAVFLYLSANIMVSVSGMSGSVNHVSYSYVHGCLFSYIVWLRGCSYVCCVIMWICGWDGWCLALCWKLLTVGARSQHQTKALSCWDFSNWQKTPGLSCNVEDPSYYRKCVLLSLTTTGQVHFHSQSRPHLSRSHAQSSVPTQMLPRTQAQTWLQAGSVLQGPCGQTCILPGGSSGHLP